MPFQPDSPDLALPLGSLILITGATGFIATHIVHEALDAGYRVRGTARSPAKAEADEKFHDNNDYHCVVVPELGLQGAFDEAVRGCDGVIHAASASDMNPDPEAVIPNSISGAKFVLESCLKEPKPKRFVYTSSSTAACLPIPGRKLHLDKKTWNDEAVTLAWETPYSATKAYVVYSASKTEAERTIWKVVQEKKPGFVTNTILPDTNYGRVLNHNPAITGSLILNIYEKGFIPSYVPSRRVHGQCLRHSKDPPGGFGGSTVTSERIYALDTIFTWNDVIANIAKARPDDAERLLSYRLKNEIKDVMTVDNSLGTSLLKKWYWQDGENGRGFKGLETSVRENLEGVAQYNG